MSLLVVHLLIAAHIAHWLYTGHSVAPVEPSEAAALAQRGIVNTGLLFFAAAILLTAVFGRFFCGWACHLLALQDASAWLLGKFGRRPKPLRSRLLRYVPWVIAFYVFIWPMVYRLWLERGLPPLHLELTTSDFWATFPGWVIGGLTFLICGGAIIYFLGAKGFCTYACPYGAFFAAAERLSPMRIRVTDACQGCGHCTAVCTSNVRVHEEVRDFGMVVDDGCMKCLDCVSVCPNDALYYGAGPLPGKASRQAARWRRPDLTWQDEIVLGLAFVLAFLTLRGLYGVVPLLMALGASGILAYFALLAYQLVTRPHLKLKGLRLKRQGRLLPASRGMIVALLVLAGLWGHSAVVRYHALMGNSAYLASRDFGGQLLDASAPPPVLSSAQHQRFENGARHLQRVADLGLMETVGAASQHAWLLALLGRSEDMVAVAEQAIERQEWDFEMQFLLARQMLMEQRRGEAADRFRQAIAAEPGRPEAHLGLGWTLAEDGNVAAAASAFEQGLLAAPSSAALAYNAGVARAAAGDSGRAIQLFERALALGPGNLAARENLAALLAAEGHLEDSAAQYRQILEQRSDRSTWNAYGDVLLALGQEEQAAAAFERAGTEKSPAAR